MKEFTSFPEHLGDDKRRGKPELFADHSSQATLFWNSQTPIEQRHIVRAFRFELTRVQTPAVRERVVAMLGNVASELAEQVAAGLGMSPVPEPLPKAIELTREPEVERSQALSLFARPGDGSIRTRRVAILVAGGVDDGVRALQSALLGAVGHAIEFVKEQYRHYEPILAVGAGVDLLAAAGVSLELPGGEPDRGLLTAPTADAALGAFVTAVAKHRHFERHADPPAV